MNRWLRIWEKWLGEDAEEEFFLIKDKQLETFHKRFALRESLLSNCRIDINQVLRMCADRKCPMFRGAGWKVHGQAELLWGCSEVDVRLLLVVIVFSLFLRVSFSKGTARSRVSPFCWIHSWSLSRHLKIVAQHCSRQQIVCLEGSVSRKWLSSSRILVIVLDMRDSGPLFEGTLSRLVLCERPCRTFFVSSVRRSLADVRGTSWEGSRCRALHDSHRPDHRYQWQNSMA